MVTSDCLTRVCESPDIACPVCGRTMSIWVWNDMPLYRCDGCNGLGFRVEEEMMAHSRDNYAPVEGELDCPGCGGRMRNFQVQNWGVDSCSGCSWVFARPKSMDEDEVLESTGSRYTIMLNWLGSMYERLIKNM